MNKKKIFLMLFSSISIDLISNPKKTAHNATKAKKTKGGHSTKGGRGGGIKPVHLSTTATTAATATTATTATTAGVGTTALSTAAKTATTPTCPHHEPNGLVLLKNSIYNKESATWQISEMKRFGKDTIVLMMRPSASEHRNYMFLYIFYQLLNKIVDKNPNLHHLLLNTDAADVQNLLPGQFKDRVILTEGHPAFLWIPKESLTKTNPLEDMKIICKRSEFNEVFKGNGNTVNLPNVNEITNFLNSSELIKALNKVLFNKAVSLGIYFNDKVKKMFERASSLDPVAAKTTTTTTQVTPPATTTTAQVTPPATTTVK